MYIDESSKICGAIHIVTSNEELRIENSTILGNVELSGKVSLSASHIGNTNKLTGSLRIENSTLNNSWIFPKENQTEDFVLTNTYVDESVLGLAKTYLGSPAQKLMIRYQNQDASVIERKNKLKAAYYSSRRS